MYIYLKIIKFSFLRFFAYPLEIVANVLKRIAGTFFIVLLWVTIRNSGATQINITSIISYYFIASGMSEFVMGQWGALSKNLGKIIKNGDINSVLIKPTNVLIYTYANAIGESGLRIIIGFVMIIIGLFISPPTNVFQVLSFIFFTLLAAAVAFSMNVFEGLIFIYIPDASGLRSGINHMKGLLGGLMVPLYLLPQNLKPIIEAGPFAAIIYYPTHAITYIEVTPEFLNHAFFAIFWAVSLNILIYFLWVRALRRYEAVGI